MRWSPAFFKTAVSHQAVTNFFPTTQKTRAISGLFATIREPKKQRNVSATVVVVVALGCFAVQEANLKSKPSCGGGGEGGGGGV